MKRGGLVRTLSVPFYPNDVIIALEENYRRDIREYYDGLLSTGADRADVEAARDTILQLLESGSRDSVLESEIQDAYSRACAQPMAGDTGGAPIVYARKRSRGGGREERCGALLRSRLNAFLLPRRDVDCESMFYLTHPQVRAVVHPMPHSPLLMICVAQMGLFIKWVENTRQELTRALRRCSNNECPETRFVAGTGRRGGAGGDKSKLKLRTSPLGWRYHLYDAVGSERVERYSVGGGAPSRSMAPRADGLASFIRLPR